LLLNGVQCYFADTSRDTICPANVVPTSTTSTTTILPVITTTLPLGTTSETTKAPQQADQQQLQKVQHKRKTIR